MTLTSKTRLAVLFRQGLASQPLLLSLNPLSEKKEPYILSAQGCGLYPEELRALLQAWAQSAWVQIPPTTG